MSKNELHKSSELFSEICSLIESSRQKIAIAINSETTMLFWHIGKRINQYILKEKRAEYGKQIFISLSQKLTKSYGSGWSEKQLRHCLCIAETFKDEQILSALSRELTWPHLNILIYIDDHLKRDFYTQRCKIEKWSTRTLQDRINSMLFERTAISKKPDETIKQDLTLLKKEKKINPDLVFRDPYLLDFLGQSETYSEQDLESAILVELHKSIERAKQKFEARDNLSQLN